MARPWEIKAVLTGSFLAISVILCVCLTLAQRITPPRMIESGGKTYLVDRTGERWDITQARSLGFDPRYFEYGIGRYTIRPLTDAALSSLTRGVPPNLRVIGVAADSKAQAYSVARLTRHEIVNGQVGATPIAAAY